MTKSDLKVGSCQKCSLVSFQSTFPMIASLQMPSCLAELALTSPWMFYGCFRSTSLQLKFGFGHK